MKKTLVTAYGPFLYESKNSSEQFLKQLPKHKQLIKKILPVGYFKQALLQPIKKYKPQRIIMLGMHESITEPRFETIAKNKHITLKKPCLRYIVQFYSQILRLFGANLQVKNKPKEKWFTMLPIEKTNIKQIGLHTKSPKIKGIEISKDAGHFVCNYTLWVVERYLRKNKLKTEFYYIHLPKKMSKKQQGVVEKFIFKGLEKI